MPKKSELEKSVSNLRKRVNAYTKAVNKMYKAAEKLQRIRNSNTNGKPQTKPLPYQEQTQKNR